MKLDIHLKLMRTKKSRKRVNDGHFIQFQAIIRANQDGEIGYQEKQEKDKEDKEEQEEEKKEEQEGGNKEEK